MLVKEAFALALDNAVRKVFRCLVHFWPFASPMALPKEFKIEL
jgi:hypothetical protein